MDLKDMVMNRMLPDDALDAVTGGVKYIQKTAWGGACTRYICQMCGSTNYYLNGHNPGCKVPGIGRPDEGPAAEFWKGGLNGCWSCARAVFGPNYPYNENEVYCPEA